MVIRPDFNPEPVIAIEGAWKVYSNGTTALRDVWLTVARGDFVFLVGPSGAGKSSLVRLLVREERASSGRLHVLGQDLSRIARRHLPRLRRRVGLVFQDFKLLPAQTVEENVAFALHAQGESPVVIGERVNAALEVVGLGEQAFRYPRQLSGGEQQRVAMARALVLRPPLLVADEPTGNLDPATAWEVMQVLLRVNAAGTTVLVATHNREIVDLLRRRVVALERGRVVRDERSGKYHEVAQAPALCAR
jgi:cell division transport system ATP-binding protein